MLDARLEVLRQLYAERQRDERMHVPLLVGSARGVTEVELVALCENDNVLVVERADGRIAYVPLDFVRSSWRERRDGETLHRIRVSRPGWRRVVTSPLVACARIAGMG